MMFWMYCLVLLCCGVVFVMPSLYGNTQRLRMAFALLASASTYWSLCQYHIWSGDASLFWARGAFSAIAIGSLSLALLAVFLKHRDKGSVPFYSILVAAHSALLYLSVSPYVVRSIQAPDRISYGWGLWVFGGYAFCLYGLF